MVERLVQAVIAAKSGDPFAPVSVLVGSPAAGVSIRRSIARHGPIANIRTFTLTAFAAAVAREAFDGPGRGPLTAGVRRRAVRAAITEAGGQGITIGDAGDHPSTVDALDARFRELRRCSPGALRSLRAVDGAAAVLAIYDRFRERVATRWYDDVDVIDEATRKLGAGGLDDDLGCVVIDSLPVLSHAEKRLLDALEAGGRIAARTGRDVDVTTIRASNVMVAPEPETEVRLAIREVFRFAGQGIPFADMAIVHPGGAYARLVPELLDAAGVPWGGRSTTSLADTVPGRALLGLLALRDSDLARGDVMALLATAPIVDPATAELVPAPSWERFSRDARVLRGAVQWAGRLDRLASEVEARGGAGTSRRLEEIGALRSFMASLATELEPPAVRTWTAFAGWALGLMRFVGSVDAEERAHIEGVVTSLAALDDVDPGGVDVAAFVDELAAQLSRPAGRRPLGEGVTIGSPHDLLGITATGVIVLGMNEGMFPRRRLDDPFLPDAVRAESGELPTRHDRRTAEHAALATILDRATESTLSAARADQRAQQQRHPSRWLLAWAPPVGGMVARRAADIPPVASFSTAILGDTPSCDQEAALQVLTSGASVGSLELGRNLDAVRARHGAVLSEWDGVVGPHPGVEIDKRVLSPTALEVWASCPFRHFLRTVLRVDPTNTPEDRVGTDPLERGTLVHEVLERFVRWRLAQPAGATAPTDEQQSAVVDRITADVCTEFESAGRVGRRVPWELEKRTLRADLAAIIALDAADAAETGFRPILAEASFGLGAGDEFATAEVDLADGRVLRFRGQVDRVDLSADRRRVRVVDYKTGRSKNYRRDLQGSRGQPPADPIAGGRRLQLPVYATAVAGRHPEAQISAEYWFVTDAAQGYPRVSVELDEATRQRFLDVLTHMADAIDDGVFPANPGADQLDTWENCRYCEFDRVCPARRSEAFERRRDDPAMVRFLGLRAVDR